MATFGLIQSTLPERSSNNSDNSRAMSYRTTIAEATQAMDPMLRLLDRRAEAYAMIGQFEQALEDAYALIRISPTLSIGYLRAGLIFQMQGKSAVAVKVYEEALSRVGTGGGGSVLEVRNRLTEATTQLERRLDPFAHLPSELLLNICGLLSENDLLQCIQVHKRWETWMEHHNLLEPFYNLHIEANSSGAAMWQRLQATSRHLRSLKLTGHLPFDAPQILDLATNPKKFENLRSLELKYCTFHAPVIIQLITRLSLTSLSIECDLLVAPSLEDILVSCPTLLQLAYKVTYRSRVFSTNTRMLNLVPVNNVNVQVNPDTCYRLQYLHVVGTTNLDTMVERIYRKCPDLHELWTDVQLVNDLLQIVDHLPKLKVLRVNATTSISSAEKDQSVYCPSSSQQQPGLRSLEIKETNDASIAEFAPLIEAHAATLEELVLTCSVPEGTQRPFFTTLPRVSTLVLSRFDNRVQDVQTILEQCPVLDSLTLQDVTIDPVLLDALCTTATLRHLTLDLCRTETAHTVDALFDHYAQRSNKSLTSVALRRIQLTGRTLCHLASIKNIQRMEFAQLHITDHDDPLSAFIQRLQQTSCVHHLTFGPLLPITDTHIRLLGDIASLTSVTLRHLDEITDEAVRALPRRIKVNVVKLYNPPPMDDDSSDGSNDEEGVWDDEQEEAWHIAAPVWDDEEAMRDAEELWDDDEARRIEEETLEDEEARPMEEEFWDEEEATHIEHESLEDEEARRDAEEFQESEIRRIEQEFWDDEEARHIEQEPLEDQEARHIQESLEDEEARRDAEEFQERERRRMEEELWDEVEAWRTGGVLLAGTIAQELWDDEEEAMRDAEELWDDEEARHHAEVLWDRDIRHIEELWHEV